MEFVSVQGWIFEACKPISAHFIRWLFPQWFVS